LRLGPTLATLDFSELLLRLLVAVGFLQYGQKIADRQNCRQSIFSPHYDAYPTGYGGEVEFRTVILHI
jgi:hypothetical protein